MNFKTIVTLGPAIFDQDKLKRIDACGDCIYRINGAHVTEAQADEFIDETKRILPESSIMMDLPGNKIRTKNLPEPIRLVKNETVILHDYQVNYPHFHRMIAPGDRILANDSVFTLEVAEILGSGVRLISRSDGLLYSNKGLHVRGIHSRIPFLFDKDRRLIALCNRSAIDYLSVSFVRAGSDLREKKRELKQENMHLIAKIETRAAMDNLKEILDEVGSILVDRGDLSTEIDMINLAGAQDMIVKTALKAGKDVYLATQFLKNMEVHPVPLISEVIDLCRTIGSGIKGIQLSEETAVGKHPVECVKLVFEALKKCRLQKEGILSG